MKFLAIAITALFCLFSNSANALHVPLPTKCLCFTGGLATTIKDRNKQSCQIVCRATKRVYNHRINRNWNYNKRISLHSNRHRQDTPRNTNVSRQAKSGDQYLIAFSGLDGAIDFNSVKKIADDQQRTLKVFKYYEADKAVAFLKQNPDSGHSFLGFSAGASASVIDSYIRQLNKANLSLPYTITTVGLYRKSSAYKNDNIPTINYIDRSGQSHDGERNVINLGADTPHFGALSKVADIIENSFKAVISPITTALNIPNSTAIYDISNHTVYLPNGEQLEAHSGLGSARDNPNLAHMRNRGPTPPNVYRLTMRETPFYGVRALRLNPINQGLMHGRDGILAHTYLHGGNGQSSGCVAFKNYAAFLSAFKRGLINKIAVVARLTSEIALNTPIEIKPTIKVATKTYNRRIRYARYNYRYYAHNYRRRHG